MNSRIYRGRTNHERLEPVRHAFQYRIYWLGIDLDELETLDRTVNGFGFNRWAIASMRERDYGGSGEGTLRDRVLARLGEQGIDAGDFRIMLMTIPRLLGYVFNPVNFYICLNDQGQVCALLAEVRNTFGEMHHYAACPEPESGPGGSSRFNFQKRFYVSPFLDDDGAYLVHVRCQADAFSATISLAQGGQTVFTASMDGHGVPFSSGNLLATLIRMPIAASSIMLRIQWQAILLRFRRGLRPHPKPKPFDSSTHGAARNSIWYWIRDRFVRYASKTRKGTLVKRAMEKERRS